jgi:hypothetical protein
LEFAKDIVDRREGGREKRRLFRFGFEELRRDKVWELLNWDVR